MIIPVAFRTVLWRRDVARSARREFEARGEHSDRVKAATGLIMDCHADALRRLGE